MAKTIQQTGYRNRTVRLMVRFLVASYFIAIATGLARFDSGRALVADIVPGGYAPLLFSAFVFTTAYLILLGRQLRSAALLLAVFVFCSSIVANLGPGKLIDLDAFWRDIALVGALLLTYVEDARPSRRARVRIGKAVQPRRVTPRAETKNPARPRPAMMAAALPEKERISPVKTVTPLQLIEGNPPALVFHRHQPERNDRPGWAEQEIVENLFARPARAT